MDKSYEYLEARPSSKLDIYYGRLSELKRSVSSLHNVLSDSEKSRVQQLRNSNDRLVYILTHSLLRLLIARELDKDPYSVDFANDKNGRPFLQSGEIFFNISHTRYAFAIALARTYVPGIDIERIDRNIDHDQIAENYFSKNEIDYITRDENRRKAFFRLWTRKESLLKSIGSGIVTDLTQVEVAGDRNTIPSVLFPDEKFNPLYEKYYIYSVDLIDHSLSITIPEKKNLEINGFTHSKTSELVYSVIEEPAEYNR